MRGSEFGVRSAGFGMPDHAVALGGNENKILVLTVMKERRNLDRMPLALD